MASLSTFLNSCFSTSVFFPEESDYAESFLTREGLELVEMIKPTAVEYLSSSIDDNLVDFLTLLVIITKYRHEEIVLNCLPFSWSFPESSTLIT